MIYQHLPIMPQEGGQAHECALPTADFQDEHTSLSCWKPMEVANGEEKPGRFCTVENDGLKWHFQLTFGRKADLAFSISELLSSAFSISYQFCKTNHATQGFKNKNYLSMNKCCDLCVWGSLRHVTGFYTLLPGILGMQVYQFRYQAFLKGHFLSFKGQMIFEKHLNTSLKDTNENTFQFSLTEIKINLNL